MWRLNLRQYYKHGSNWMKWRTFAVTGDWSLDVARVSCGCKISKLWFATLNGQRWSNYIYIYQTISNYTPYFKLWSIPMRHQKMSNLTPGDPCCLCSSTKILRKTISSRCFAATTLEKSDATADATGLQPGPGAFLVEEYGYAWNITIFIGKIQQNNDTPSTLPSSKMFRQPHIFCSPSGAPLATRSTHLIPFQCVAVDGYYNQT